MVEILTESIKFMWAVGGLGNYFLNSHDIMFINNLGFSDVLVSLMVLG